jgi:hypothetical protein
MVSASLRCCVRSACGSGEVERWFEARGDAAHWYQPELVTSLPTSRYGVGGNNDGLAKSATCASLCSLSMFEYQIGAGEIWKVADAPATTG